MSEKLTPKFRQMKFQNSHIASILKEQNYSKLIKSKTKFTDDLFPPNEHSIYSGNTDFSNPKILPEFLLKNLSNPITQRQEKKNYTWKRITELYDEKTLNIISEPSNIKENPNILSQDVIQGEIGDCYFLSVLSALASNPKQLKSLFTNLALHPNGIFEVKVVIHGEPVQVVVDDFFPCIKHEDGTFGLAFTRLNEATRNLWPLILEKVWAKLNLNYESIIDGNAGDAFAFLSVAPFETYYHDVQNESFFGIIKNAHNQEFLISTAITDGTGALDNLAKMGLVTNHAYTVVNVFEFTELSGKKVGLLKLRNPWGNNEWKGEWSESSNRWTEQIKNLVDYSEDDKGIFFISIEDYLKFYSTTFISKMNEAFYFNSNKFSFNPEKHFNLIQIRVSREGEGYVVLNQKNTRLYKNTKGISDFENQYVSLILFTKTGDDYKILGSTGSREDRLSIECLLTEGVHYLAVSFPFKIGNSEYNNYKVKYRKHHEALNLTYQVGVYSFSDKIIISEVPEKENQKVNSYLIGALQNRALNNKQKYNFVQEGEKEVWRSVSYNENESPLGFIIYHNPSNAYIRERLSFSTIKNTNVIADVNNKIKPIEDSFDNVEEELDRKALVVLRNRETASSFKPHNEPKEITKKSRFDIEITVSPRSDFIIFLEKYEEEAEIAFDSSLILEFPLHALLLENSKFQRKKNRVKYEDKLIDVFETIIEHNTGVLFKYKNKTKDMKFSAVVNLKDLRNLEISTKSIDLELEGEVDSDQGIELKNNEFSVNIEPGQSQFIELKSIDHFQNYAYETDVKYTISFTKKK